MENYNNMAIKLYIIIKDKNYFHKIIFNKKKFLIKERNNILDSLIKSFFLKKKLKKNGHALDALDLEIYFFEKENKIKQSELDEMVQKAEARLKKYFSELEEFGEDFKSIYFKNAFILYDN